MSLKKDSMTTYERLETRRTEQLKDRRDLRETLIQRRSELDVKISEVEAQIKKLRGSA